MNNIDCKVSESHKVIILKYLTQIFNGPTPIPTMVDDKRAQWYRKVLVKKNLSRIFKNLLQKDPQMPTKIFKATKILSTSVMGSAQENSNYTLKKKSPKSLVADTSTMIKHFNIGYMVPYMVLIMKNFSFKE